MSHKNTIANSRLYTLFMALEAKDHKVLKKWVRSPFFNQREHVVKLFDFLHAGATKNGKPPERTAAFAYLWPQLPYDDHKLRLSMSLLLKCLEQYLLWKQVNKEEVAAQLKLSEAYRELGLDRHFVKSMKEAKRLQQSSSIRDAHYFQNQHAFFLEQYHFKAQQNRMKGLPLEDVQNNLDLAYLAAKLKQSCSMLSHQAIYKKEYTFGMLPEVLRFVEANDYLRYPAIAVYYYAYQAFRHEAHENYFREFKAALFTHQAYFPAAELRDLFLLATNYCIQQLNKGLTLYAKEGLDIYKEGLKNDLLLRNGILSNFTYTNIVAKAILSKDYEWANTFVSVYRQHLEPQHQDSSYFYNLAWLKYEQQEYGEALDLLNRTSFNDLLLNISAKTIAMKIYYELEAFDLLYSHLEAMRTFLHRKKMMAYHKESYANTIKFVRKILDLPPSDTERRERLRQEITAVAAVAERRWLLERVGNWK